MIAQDRYLSTLLIANLITNPEFYDFNGHNMKMDLASVKHR